VWGGARSYEGDKTESLLTAIRDFTEYNPDPKASLMAGAEMRLFGSEVEWIVFFFYDGPSPPQGIFDNFTKIRSAEDHTKTQKYHEMLYANNDYYRNNSFNSVGVYSINKQCTLTWYRCPPKLCRCRLAKTQTRL
jgi:hypothetical protein